MKKRSRRILFAAVLLAAAVFLLRWGWDRLQRSLYPRTYASIVATEAAENGLDPNLVYAVIRQESGFNADAESGAGALGLMQLTPDTFQWLLQQESADTSLTADSLRDPQTNIRYGCRFLALLKKRYSVLRTALCAYNAGMGRVDSWLEDSSVSSDGKNLDTVPYRETREYAEKVLDNYRRYQEIYGDK
jgi:soluble lytic murein transglycosylase